MVAQGRKVSTMINKIISGGQTGADQAALDTAIEMGIPHGGWIPKGRKTEKGRLPDKYRMQETNAIDYAQRTELNILDSDGTLLFSHGVLKGGSELTQRLAGKHKKPCLHIDLNDLSEYKAVEIIKTWLDARDIKILNVAGARESEDSRIYEAVCNILKSVLYPPPEYITQQYPRTVQEAVERLLDLMPEREKSAIARMEEDEVHLKRPSLFKYINEKFGLGPGNVDLMRSCRYISHKYHIEREEATSIIIKALWKKLSETHSLRIIK